MRIRHKTVEAVDNILIRDNGQVRWLYRGDIGRVKEVDSTVLKKMGKVKEVKNANKKSSRSTKSAS